MSARTTPRRTLVLTGAAAGLALAVAAPLAASAHVTVSPEEAAAGSYSVLTFAFSHGCDGSPTTALAIDIPEGVESVAPQIQPGWSIALEGPEGLPDRVVFTADEPVQSGLRATVTVQVKLGADLAGESVAFPVTQTCAEGETAWTELAEAGQDPHDLDAPAPIVAVGEAAADDHAAGHDTAEVEDAESSAPAADTSALPIALGAAGVVLGAAGLVAGLVALRRTRRS